MSEIMKMKIIGSEIIKPSSPTPSKLKISKLSLLDQLSPIVYIPLVLFYPKNDITADQKSQQLKKSLSKVLTIFYPFAGRIKDNIFIECHDDGVQYIEAEFSGLLSTLLEHPDAEVLNGFIPTQTVSQEAASGPPLLVKATFFECGGLAIGVCISHKIADAVTLSTFIRAWASIAFGQPQKGLPDFRAIFELIPGSNSTQQPKIMWKKMKSVTKRFVFDATKIASLKIKAASETAQSPTRFEVVISLIWKCAVSATSSSLGSPINSLLVGSVNLRKRVEPTLPENSIGNFIKSFVAENNEKSSKDVRILVNELRKSIQVLDEKLTKRLRGDKASEVIIKNSKEVRESLGKKGLHVFTCTSWCNMKLYETDFGWGKPIWVSNSMNNSSFLNVASLIDTREEGGVEAWVTLSEEDMALFECDPEIVAFALPNPSVFRS